MDDLKQLDQIVDDWQRKIEPNPLAFIVAHVMMRNAQQDQWWCSHLLDQQSNHRATGAGLSVHDMLSFGLMVMNHIGEVQST